MNFISWYFNFKSLIAKAINIENQRHDKWYESFRRFSVEKNLRIITKENTLNVKHPALFAKILPLIPRRRRGAMQRKCNHPIKSKSKMLLHRDNVEIGREDAYESRRWSCLPHYHDLNYKRSGISLFLPLARGRTALKSLSSLSPAASYAACKSLERILTGDRKGRRQPGYISI